MDKTSNKEHPIIFTSDMVKAILNLSKKQTRRIVKPQPVWVDYPEWMIEPDKDRGFWAWQKNKKTFETSRPDGPFDTFLNLCPYSVGDKLWVKETYLRPGGGYIDEVGEYVWSWDGNTQKSLLYCADGHKSAGRLSPDNPRLWYRKMPSIHMPRWASRILLDITNVRIERLNQIRTLDCIHEGIPQTWGGFGDYPPEWAIQSISERYGDAGSHLYDNRTSKENFILLWESIYGKESWEQNPWVWVLDFDISEETKKWMLAARESKNG